MATNTLFPALKAPHLQELQQQFSDLYFDVYDVRPEYIPCDVDVCRREVEELRSLRRQLENSCPF